MFSSFCTQWVSNQNHLPCCTFNLLRILIDDQDRLYSNELLPSFEYEYLYRILISRIPSLLNYCFEMFVPVCAGNPIGSVFILAVCFFPIPSSNLTCEAVSSLRKRTHHLLADIQPNIKLRSFPILPGIVPKKKKNTRTTYAFVGNYSLRAVLLV